MKRLSLLCASAAVIGFSLGGPAVADAEGRFLGLRQALILAEDASPSLKAARARESGAHEAVTAVQSGYFPTLDLAAVDSTGFPGSASGLGGLSGIVASPYREGPSADAYVQWNLVDASVWYAAAAARYDAGASHEAAKIELAQVDEGALEVYLQAAAYRGEEEAWKSLADALKRVRDTVKNFIRNGQYSEVQGLLIQDQLDDAEMRRQDYDRQYRMVLERLAILTGLAPGAFACPAPSGLHESELSASLGGGGASPLVLRADDEAQAAEESAKKYSSENLPKIELGGSAGYLNQSRLVRPQDYSALVGVTLPLFEGFKTDASEKAAEHERDARVQESAGARLALDDFNARTLEKIAQGRDDLGRLVVEQGRAARAVALARDRYLHFLGPLSDLQQALKDRVSVDSQLAEVKAHLLLAVGSKAFVNGGMVLR